MEAPALAASSSKVTRVAVPPDLAGSDPPGAYPSRLQTLQVDDPGGRYDQGSPNVNGTSWDIQEIWWKRTHEYQASRAS